MNESNLGQNAKHAVGAFIGHSCCNDPRLDNAYHAFEAGDVAATLEVIEPLAREYDVLIEDQWSHYDYDIVPYFTGTEAKPIVFFDLSDGREAPVSVKPFAQVYFLYGSCLLEVERFDEAIRSLRKSAHWNPCRPVTHFKMGQAYLATGNMNALDRCSNKAYPYIATAKDMALYHRRKGLYYVQMNQLERAAAHFLCSLPFQFSEEPLHEIARMKTSRETDFANMTLNDAEKVLERLGDPVAADANAVAQLEEAVHSAVAQGDIAGAVNTSTNLYHLTGNERFKTLADDLSRQSPDVFREYG